jgi:putative MFS transporter
MRARAAPPSFWQQPLRGRVLFLVVANGASSIGFYGFANWLPTLVQSGGVSAKAAFAYTAAIGLTFPLASLACTLFADRIERKWQIVGTAIVSASLGLVLSRQPLGPLWVIAGVGLAFSNQARVTAEHAYRSELFPTAIRARAVGIVYSFTRVAAASSSYAVGSSLAHGGPTAVFALLACSLAMCALVTGLFGPLTGAAIAGRPREVLR